MRTDRRAWPWCDKVQRARPAGQTDTFRRMTPPLLTRRALGRATLARQQLLTRATTTPEAMVAQLAGLQAQLARPPFVGLWTRLDGFAREQLLAPIHARRLVRATLMRGTLHVVTAADYLALRAPLQAMLAAGAAGTLGARQDDLDVDTVLAAARDVLGAEGPLPFDALRDRLAARLPTADVRAMGHTVRMHLPLVQVPDERAAWGWDAKAPFTPAGAWLDAPCATDTSPETLVRRYLAAFGPATAADASAWSGLRKLGPVFTALRDQLHVLHDERGRELFDLPDAPRPDEDADAPVRFLPEYDNAILGHADRTRIVPAAYASRLVTRNLQIPATVLIDGMVAGTWRVARARGTATLTVQPFATLAPRDVPALEAEGEALARFVEPAATTCVVQIADAS